MRRLFIKFCLILSSSICFAQSKPLYQLPDLAKQDEVQISSDLPLLAGSDTGLYKISSNGSASPLWTEGKVTQILRSQPSEGQEAKWYFLTSKGVLSSDNLSTFTECNSGLPFLTIKKYDGKKKSLELQPALLKDICIDPLDSNNLVTATKDDVYLSRDGGQSWKSIGSTSAYTAGMKAVAVAHMPLYAKDASISGSELVVFMSHPIYGFSYYRADAKKPAWIDISGGFAALPTLTPDEVSDIIPVLCQDDKGTVYTEIFCAQSFMPNIYRINWKSKRAESIYKGSEKAGTIDSLCQSKEKLFYVTMGGIEGLSLKDGSQQAISTAKWQKLLYSAGVNLNTAFIPPEYSELETALTLNELWLLKPDSCRSPYQEVANGKKAVYTSAYQVRNLAGINRYKKIISDNKLNTIVVEMKDDFGMIHFDPNTPNIKEKDAVSQYKINFDEFVPEFKKDNVYLVARVVVFKDKNLAFYDKNQYAVWNSATNSPWVGIRGVDEIKDEEGNVTGKKTRYYDENWVDPYSEQVWEYNIQIAQELIERGFDEIQFDYIRFPTDGTNLRNASYRWKDKGMDKESSLVSFLSYARENIKAPIGIDIYGANGWYRSSTRTGQDVELMSDYVDVICPMFYPSHFEQNFLEYAPVKERPYRIYFYGSYHNSVIGRNKVIIRPWVQAFYMGVRYDRNHYDADYVKREIFGTRDGLDRGYMFWNNSGRYVDISPDPGTAESPWKNQEAPAYQEVLPAFGSKNPGQEQEEVNSNIESPEEQKKHDDDIISILDTVLNQEWESGSYSGPNTSFLHVHPFAPITNGLGQ